jgi:hypothetical protein
MFIKISSKNLIEVNIQNRTGTITIPPPTPNRPAISPPTIPVTNKPRKYGRSS